MTANSIIYTQTVEENYEKEYSLFKERIVKYIIPKILSEYKIVVRRLGVVYVKELTKEELHTFSSKFFLPSVADILDFKFSKKEPTVKGNLFVRNNDFVNKIYTVGNVKTDTQGISYDYQLHFDPLREDVREEIEKFILNADANFKNDILEQIGEKNEKKTPDKL